MRAVPQHVFRHSILFLSAFALAMSVSACNGAGSDPASGSTVGQISTPTGSDSSASPQTPPGSNPSSLPAPGIGTSCHSDDPNKICLALKYVAYDDGSGNRTVSSSTVLSNLASINSIWSQCGIAFQVDNYDPINPADYGLNYATSSSGELDSIRRALEDNDTLLVVTTGTWSGSLGAGSANAWTNMPGGGLYGVVLEASVGDFGPIVAHELGHYLGLDHISDTSDVMNPLIYSTSTKLTTSQCNAARSVIQSYWKAMQR